MHHVYYWIKKRKKRKMLILVPPLLPENVPGLDELHIGSVPDKVPVVLQTLLLRESPRISGQK